MFPLLPHGVKLKFVKSGFNVNSCIGFDNVFVVLFHESNCIVPPVRPPPCVDATVHIKYEGVPLYPPPKKHIPRLSDAIPVPIPVVHVVVPLYAV